MRLNIQALGTRVVDKFTKTKFLVTALVRSVIDARNRRIASEREFYRNLNAYCRANNVPPVCEDDWKTAAYAANDDDRSTAIPKEMCHGQR